MKFAETMLVAFNERLLNLCIKTQEGDSEGVQKVAEEIREMYSRILTEYLELRKKGVILVSKGAKGSKET